MKRFPPVHPALVVLATLAALSLAAVATGTQLSKVTEVAIYTLYGLGVNLLVGYVGLVPFGASVFFGLATYAAAITSLRFGGGETLGLLVALAFVLGMALLLGLVTLRRRGLYFSLLTLACSQLAFEVVYKWTDLTGGENGLQNVPRTLFASPLRFHLFVLACVGIGAVLLWRIVHSPFGRTLQAIRDNEQRATAIGYDTYAYKLGAFVLAAGFIGFAGALLAYMLQGAYANNLGWQQAGDALLMTVLGGVHHFLGPLWGAIAFIVLTDQLSALLEQWWLVFGPILIVLMLVSPEGIQGLAQRAVSRRERWTLVRRGVPPRPAVIEPFSSAADGADLLRPVLEVRGLGKRFGSLVTASDISLDVMPRSLHSFIGPNGAGKTTFFNMLTGLTPADVGTIRFAGRDVTRMATRRRARLGLARSFQIISLFPHLTAFETVRVAVQSRDPLRTRLLRDGNSLADAVARTWSLLDAVGLADHAAELSANLGHGEQRLLDIAVTLATDGRLLLLDEPLAGLADADRGRVGALIRKLASTHAVLLIEHDIDRVLALSDRVSVLHQGRLIADGPPATVAADPAVAAAYLGQGGAKPAPRARGPRTAVSGPLLEATSLTAGYGGSTVLDGIDLEVGSGEVVALLGRNGVGKTTTLRAITGVLAPTGGRIVFAGRQITGWPSHAINRAGIAMVPEGRRLFPNLTVAENLALAARPGGLSLEGALDLFPRLRERRRAKADTLSGGERQMAAIVRALMTPAKLILLDEPFEGLAPAIVGEVMEAVVRLRDRAAVVIVEHKAELILPIVDRAYVLVNGTVAWQGDAQILADDEAAQTRLLGLV